MAIERDTRAAASPTKDFFVRMITRDISLEDCILDLIDNSVDGAWRSEGSRPMGLAEDADLSAYTIKIAASVDSFSIEDNCGGMTLDDAVKHAFSFGRKTDDGHDDYSIGVYGIGMKRAIFKLGTDIRISSTYVGENGTRESFAVPINVAEWTLNDAPPWDFDIVEDDLLPENGVKIVVNALTQGASGLFDSPAFIQDLRRTIARDYSLHLNRGLKVLLNDKPIVGWQIELRQSDEFAAVRVEYEDDSSADKVVIEIIGGMAASPPESADPDEEDDGDKRFGWYVVCNGRIVLAADKTVISGWGTEDWPQWHRQYSGFIGLILFTAANAAALPLTTTKRSVDLSSEVYRRARPRMREITKSWIAYTNARKQSLENAKQKEAAAVAIPIYSVPLLAAVRLPMIAPRVSETPANVHYAVPTTRMKKLAKALGSVNLTYRDVGLKSFDYAYDDLVGED
jgi:hypothetical protein